MNPTIPSTIPEAEMREDLSATQSASPARLGEDLVALLCHAWADQPTNPPTPASSMGNEGKEYPKWIEVCIPPIRWPLWEVSPSVLENPSATMTAALGGRKELVILSWRRNGGTFGIFLGMTCLKTSLELMLLSKEDKCAEPKEQPLGF